MASPSLQISQGKEQDNQGLAALSTGCLTKLAAGKLLVPSEDSPGPAVQVIFVKAAECGSDECRARLQISDGNHHALAFLADDIREPKNGSIIQLLDWKVDHREGQLTIFVEDWDAFAEPCAIIGQPVALAQEHMVASPSDGMRNPYQAHMQPPQKAEHVHIDWQKPPGMQPQPQLPRPKAPQRCEQQQAVQPRESAVFHTPSRARAGPTDDPVSPFRNGAPMEMERFEKSELAAGAPLPLIQIAQLSMLNPTCRLRARVVSKSSIRSFRSARGQGFRFSVDIMGADHALTRLSFWGSAVEKYFNVICVKGIYEITGACVKVANPRFCSYPMELTVDDRHGKISALPDDGSIPQIPYNFVPLSQLGDVPVNSMVDVLGVVIKSTEIATITTRNGERQKREITMVDNSSTTIALTLWGHQAQIHTNLGSVIFVRSAKVSDFKGRSLDLNDSSFVDVDPDDSRAFQLQAWFQGGGKDLPICFALSDSQTGSRGRKRNLAEVRMEDAALPLVIAGPGISQNHARSVNRHEVAAYVVAVPHERPPFYEACTVEVPGFNEGQTRGCNKKVVDGRCSAGHSCPQPAVRYNLFLKVADAFSSVFCGAFGDQAERLAGIPASELARLYGNMQCGDIEAGQAYEAAFRKMLSGPWSLSLKCRKEAWEGRERMTISVESCSSVDLVKDAYSMADAVRQAIGAPRSV